MKRWKEILIGLALVAGAILVAVYVDSGYQPDSMDCGSSALTSWRGNCDDSDGWLILALLKCLAVIVMGLLGLGLIIPHGKEKKTT